ncbi:MAG: hypothetical protein IPH16_09570 [Haliscomenobacter sp.]|nr:hypothetical protein [Haliscomenobacter sp.]MBK8879484.1 hypothetical protein [Haliscomenobacter sp.]
MLKKKKDSKRKDQQPTANDQQTEAKLKRKKMVREKPKYNNPKHWLLQNEDELT